MSQYGRFLVTMLAFDALGYAVVILVTPANSLSQLAALVPVLLIAPFVSRRIVYGEWLSRSIADDEEDETTDATDATDSDDESAK